LVTILATQPHDFVEVRICREHAEGFFYTAQGPQRPQLAPQLRDLPFQVVHSFFQLFQCHDYHRAIAQGEWPKDKMVSILVILPRTNGHANGNGPPPSRAGGKARSRPSVRQLEYVQELVGQVGLDAEQIEGLCRRLFAKPRGELSGGETSGLIRALQEMRESCLEPEAVYRPEGE